MGVIGNINRPDYLAKYGDITPSGSGPGLLGLVSNIIKIIIVVGGIWSLFNIIIAGMIYITSGEKPEELEKAHQKIYMSIIGVLVMVASFAITGIIGLLLYGNAGAILNPELYGPGSVTENTNTPTVINNQDPNGPAY